MSLDRYLAGEDDQLDAAIVEFMPLVDSVVERFVTKAPGFAHLSDELTSEGYARLVEAIPKMRESIEKTEKANPRGYLTRAVKDAIIRCLRDETNLGMGHMTWRRMTKDGRTIPAPSLTAVEDDRTNDPFEVIELRETILDCCRSAEERMIVDMREQGFTYREIADELDMSLDTVHKFLNDVHSRLQLELDS